MEHGEKTAGRGQLTAGSKQNSEVRHQRSAVTYKSDL
jgi:hypothetical protein